MARFERGEKIMTGPSSIWSPLMSGNGRYLSKTPEPQHERQWEWGASSAPGKQWTSYVSTSAVRSGENSDDAATTICVEDLNPSIPHSDLEQGLYGLFSVFGNVSSVATVSGGECFVLNKVKCFVTIDTLKN